MPKSNPLSIPRQPLGRELSLAALYARDDRLLDRIRDLESHGHRDPARTRCEIDRLQSARHQVWLQVEPLLPEPPPPLLTSEPACEPESREGRAYNRRRQIIGHDPPWSDDELRLTESVFRQATREREKVDREAMLARARRLLDTAQDRKTPTPRDGDRRQTVLAAWNGRREAGLSRYEIREATGLAKSVVQRAVARMLREGILSTNGDRTLRLSRRLRE